MNVGVFGATGQVGTVIRQILVDRKFPITKIRFFASSRSAGTTLLWRGEEVVVEDARESDFSGIDVALFSIGASASKELAPKVAAAGALVIDNSAAWRMEVKVPLVVPEVNGSALDDIPLGIIANPNCTTMIAMSPLMALDRLFGLKRVVVSTYQAVSGAGLKGVEELRSQLAVGSDQLVKLTYDGHSVKFPEHSSFPATVAANVLPYAGSFIDHDTTEEIKFISESKKILGRKDLKVAATCVRVPVFTGHSLSILAEFESEPDVELAIEALGKAPGVRYDPVPTPQNCAGRDEVLVGRVRRDPSSTTGLNIFVSGDNLRKGAALNAVQIAEELVSRDIISA